MSDKTVIYGKRNGEPRVPLTVRIDWLPNGGIRPTMYWTPDGTCYAVAVQYERVSLAFLGARDEGLRFRVQAEAADTSQPCSEPVRAQYETYIYLADRRFCERDIIDGRYGHDGKEYIRVMMDVFPDGDYELVYFWVRGARYKVEQTVRIEPRGSFRAGGVGICHRLEARLVNDANDDDPDPQNCVRRSAALYLELNKWFVAAAKGDDARCARDIPCSPRTS